MAGFSLHVPVDNEEIVEACAVFARWKDRIAELPVSLRQEIDALLATYAEGTVEAVADGPGVAFVLTPRVRALVANLRAREG